MTCMHWGVEQEAVSKRHVERRCPTCGASGRAQRCQGTTMLDEQCKAWAKEGTYCNTHDPDAIDARAKVREQHKCLAITSRNEQCRSMRVGGEVLCVIHLGQSRRPAVRLVGVGR